MQHGLLHDWGFCGSGEQDEGYQPTPLGRETLAKSQDVLMFSTQSRPSP